MFGWLSSFGVPSRARTAPTVHWLALAPRTLFQGLGQLGSVLYLAPPAPAAANLQNAGCLVESAELAPLLATRYVGLTSAITAEGPREWLDCVSGQGDTLARIYLLPDTDYLAWDGLFADALPIDAPPRQAPDRAWVRAARARVLSFSRRRLAGLELLASRDARISTLGHGVARDIALSESVNIRG